MRIYKKLGHLHENFINFHPAVYLQDSIKMENKWEDREIILIRKQSKTKECNFFQNHWELLTMDYGICRGGDLGNPPWGGILAILTFQYVFLWGFLFFSPQASSSLYRGLSWSGCVAPLFISSQEARVLDLRFFCLIRPSHSQESSLPSKLCPSWERNCTRFSTMSWKT